MKSQLISKVSTAACLTCFLVGTSLNAHAFGMPSFGGGGSSSSVDTGKLVETSKELVENYTLSMKKINYAQAEALDAFGLGKQAEQARQDAKAFEGGVVDGDAGDKLVANSQERDELINKHLGKKQKLQGDARTHLVESAEAYAGASYAGVKILENMKKWSSEATDAMSSLKTDPMKLSSLKSDIDPGLYVMSKLPSLSSKWIGTSSSLIDYASMNGDKIDTSKAERTISKELGLM